MATIVAVPLQEMNNQQQNVKPSNDYLFFREALEEERAVLRPATPSTPANLSNPAPRQSNPISALCISGGGIRSATFALGALQGLAQHRLLSTFDYLSIVSGGGYTEAWLSAWIQRRKGLAHINAELCPIAPGSRGREPRPVQHLREYNNYLSPKLGLLSADGWTLGTTVIRGDPQHVAQLACIGVSVVVRVHASS